MRNINYRDNPLKIFASYIAGHKKLFFIDMLCAVAVSAIDLIFPYVSRMSMNELLPKNLYSTFFAVMGIMLLAYFVKAALYYVITVVGHRMGVLVESDMRQDLFNHMQQLSFSFYDQNRTGVLLSRITSDLFDITELAHHGPENLLICCLTLIGALIVMFSINWQLGLVLIIVLPICIAFTLVQRVRMKTQTWRSRKRPPRSTPPLKAAFPAYALPRPLPTRTRRTKSLRTQTRCSAPPRWAITAPWVFS